MVDLLDEDYLSSDYVVRWKHCMCTYLRVTPAGTQEDAAVIGFDLLRNVNGALVPEWDSATYASAEGPLDAFFGTVTAQMHNSHTLSQYRWYTKQFNSTLSATQPYLPSGPPERVTTKNLPGANASGVLPYQVALSVTEKTAIPKHWGRFYLPGIIQSKLANTTGRWGSADVDLFCTAAHTLYDDWYDAGFGPVVPMLTLNKVPQRALMSVRGLQVDDIPDIVRRRRASSVAYRKVLPVGA